MSAPFVLIAFRFPPYDRIGAYRWSKLCGRLARQGHSIDVLTVPWPKTEDPGWFSDVEHPHIRIHRINSLYPHRFRNARPKIRILQRVHGRLVRTLDQLAPSHDVASLWGYTLLPAAKRVLAETGAKVVIATGAPFSANYWAARLCKEHRNLRLIQDFRDPWLDTEAEMLSSPWAKRFKLATRQANVLVSVTEDMSSLFQRLSGHSHVVTIPNGVEIAQLGKLSPSSSLRFDFAYAGGLFNRREEPLRRFLAWLREKKRQAEVLRVAIAGLYPNHLPAQYRDLVQSGHLHFFGLLPQPEAFQLLMASRFALQFNGPVPYALVQTTTKLVEHAALKRPTLSLNYGGTTEQFIRSRNLGVSLNADSPTLFQELDLCWKSDVNFDTAQFNITEFDFDTTAQRYSELIDSLNAR